jgi:hypothetical protein
MRCGTPCCRDCGGILDAEWCDFNGSLPKNEWFQVLVCNNSNCKSFRVALGSGLYDVRKYLKKLKRGA